MTMRPLTRPRAHLLNHAELVYGPGDRPLARRLLEVLGFRVVDPRTDPVPESLGPAAAPYLIVYLDRDDDDPIDNVLYVSEMSVEQAEFEALLRDRMADDEALGARLRALVEAFVERPQAMPHLGIAYADADGVRSALARVAGDPALAGRVRVSPLFEPGLPGSVDDRVVQGFVHTDVFATGLVCAGQQIELQVRLDGR
ncbi:MAG TPA: hypothetical protein PLW10_23760 [Myxococcota bacterium]|nr:hypothetical protein [Myxococcota bacterium]